MSRAIPAASGVHCVVLGSELIDVTFPNGLPAAHQIWQDEHAGWRVSIEIQPQPSELLAPNNGLNHLAQVTIRRPSDTAEYAAVFATGSSTTKTVLRAGRLFGASAGPLSVLKRIEPKHRKGAYQETLQHALTHLDAICDVIAAHSNPGTRTAEHNPTSGAVPVSRALLAAAVGLPVSSVQSWCTAFPDSADHVTVVTAVSASRNDSALDDVLAWSKAFPKESLADVVAAHDLVTAARIPLETVQLWAGHLGVRAARPKLLRKWIPFATAGWTPPQFIAVRKLTYPDAKKMRDRGLPDDWANFDADDLVAAMRANISLAELRESLDAGTWDRTAAVQFAALLR